jgi:hypothetical protein
MGYDIEYVSSVIVTMNEMRPNMSFETYLSYFAPLQQDLIRDILCDLDKIKEVVKPKPWYEPEPAWSRNPEYMWVWKDDE